MFPNIFITNKTGKGEFLKQLELTQRQFYDFYLLAVDGFKPLDGFMNRQNWQSVCETMKLTNGDVFPMPIILTVDDETKSSLSTNDSVNLIYQGDAIGVLEIGEIWEYTDEMRKIEAEKIYLTTEDVHPGVANLYKENRWALAGKICSRNIDFKEEAQEYCFTPAQLKVKFTEKGWNTIVAFQTRNPVHRAHEYLQKVAMESIDGLLLHPIVGQTKSDDIPTSVRMDCYKTLLEKYYPNDRTLLAALPANMRYAGPREAVLHAIMRRNYGATHFIVGRDHAGVGNYYGTYDAQDIFTDELKTSLGIEILKFEHAFFCTACGNMVSSRTCPHSRENHVFLSGTKVREMLRNGENLPETFTRREVSDVLKKWINE